ncbi:hypothetical protein KR059_007814 [Drosophila kikkawai]|nr:hypothetical protein KR059_007814 [Drosophila kikkawai]
MKCLCVDILLSLVLWTLVVTSEATWRIYEMIAKEQQNLVLSPFSIEIALGLVYMGAAGKTAQELAEVLKLSEDKQEVARKYRELVSKLPDQESGTFLKLVNRIYVNEKYSLRSEFNQAVQDSFKGDTQSIDLASGGEKAAKSINQWVLEQTNGRIKDIVSPDDLEPNTKAILVNALYFKGLWKHKFIVENTKNEAFHLSTQKSVSVPMMSRYEGFMAADLPEWQAKVLELPFKRSELSMVIFLPYAVDGLSTLEEKITGFSTPLKMTGVTVKLPKFKFEFSQSLVQTLRKLGIIEIFTSKCDLGGLLAGGEAGAQFDEVTHKSFIEVDEYGAEAAASNGKQSSNCYFFGMINIILGNSIVFVAKARSGRSYALRMNFTADHPFAFVIRDGKNIYFQGHVVRP